MIKSLYYPLPVQKLDSQWQWKIGSLKSWPVFHSSKVFISRLECGFRAGENEIEHHFAKLSLVLNEGDISGHSRTSE